MLSEVVKKPSIVTVCLFVRNFSVAPYSVAYCPRRAREMGEIDELTSTLPSVAVVYSFEQGEVFGIGDFRSLKECFTVI